MNGGSRQVLMTVIIPYNNNREQILSVLDRLEKLKEYNLRFETRVIISSGIVNLEKEICELFPETIIERKNKDEGMGYTMNRVADKSCGNELLFLEPSIQLKPLDLLTFFQHKIIHKEYSILTTRQHSIVGDEVHCSGFFNQAIAINQVPKITFTLFSKDIITGVHIVPVKWVSNSLLIIDKRSFLKAGGWSEDEQCQFPGIDLSIKVLKQNGKIGCVKNISFQNLSTSKMMELLPLTKNYLSKRTNQRKTT